MRIPLATLLAAMRVVQLRETTPALGQQFMRKSKVEGRMYRLLSETHKEKISDSDATIIGRISY